MPPLDQSLSSSLHSVGSSNSGTRIFARARHNLALSKTCHSNKTINDSKRSSTTSSTPNFDSELRTAKDACIGAMMALLHYLSHHNISSGTCVHELHQTIPQCNHYQYDLILRRIIHEYVMKLSIQVRNDEVEIIHMLVLGCWQAQQRFAQVQYQKAYRYYHNLRSNNNELQSYFDYPSTKIASSAISSFAIGVSTPPLHQSKSSIPGVAASSSTCTTMNGVRRLEGALHHQIQMAEYVCACQKEIILCNRKYEQLQQQ